MLKRVGLFGVRRRINEIVEFLNDCVVEVNPGWGERVEGKFEGIRLLFGLVFRRLEAIRVEQEKQAKQLKNLRQALMLVHAIQTVDKIDNDVINHTLETLEGLDARVTNLEDLLFPPDQTEPEPEQEVSLETPFHNSDENPVLSETDEKNLPSPEEDIAD